MGQPYVGEIRMFAGIFAPVGWMFCDGTLIPVSENETLFNLIGTTYGGDATNFALPDLRNRVPIHQSSSYTVGQSGGSAEVALTSAQIPSHNHELFASLNNAGANTPTGNVTGQVGATQIYREVAPADAMSGSAMALAGESQGHNNMQPYLYISYIISLFGVFPPHN